MLEGEEVGDGPIEGDELMEEAEQEEGYSKCSLMPCSLAPCFDFSSFINPHFHSYMDKLVLFTSGPRIFLRGYGRFY